MLNTDVPSETQLPDHPLPLEHWSTGFFLCLRFSIAQTIKKIFIKEVCSV